MSSTDDYPCEVCGTYVPISDILITIHGLQICPDCYDEDDLYDEWEEVDL
ncbi:hypothetical protein UFOVP346_7 [uncultured Caudovirales phage]|uniref:Uncharacterized protein n=1 Tax=uncultured Caudovirales phage TaxID=2100421 RepID=A0A6J5LYJ0_9CAUD|nr:hypothetical protein UFOVP346_7 [uncultured Caudovirales phage]